MRKLLVTLALLLPLSVAAQVKMSGVLRSMPDTLCGYLTENNRLDLIDFKAAGMRAEVRNVLDGRSELVTLTDRYALLQLSTARTVALRLLDHDGGGQLLCLVATYGTDIQESTIAFFTPDWQPLEADHYVALPTEMYTARLGDEEATLTIAPSTALDRPANEEQQVIEKPLTELKWNGKEFK